jgi:NADPH-dependent 2,4-dienoyl-CoA reductase/sulfur reductase-like enzyme
MTGRFHPAHRFQTLVVGSGPAGIAAAVCAAEAGHRVGMVDDNPNPGGQIWRSLCGQSTPDTSHGGSASDWYSRLIATSATRLQGWSVFDQPEPGILRAERQSETVHLHYDHLILATGARERFLPFPGWTLPNVMGVGAIQAMVKGGLPVDGRRIVLAGSGPLLLAVAAALKAARANVICVCEQAPLRQLAPFVLGLMADPAKIVQGLRYKAATSDIPFHTGAWPVEAEGDDILRSVTLSHHGERRRISCDYLACGFHLVPNTELAAMLGCLVKAGSVSVDELQRTSMPNIFCAGEPTGIGGLELSLIEGQVAGLASAGRAKEARLLFEKRRKVSRFADRLAAAFRLRPELKELPQETTLVCRCEDVPYGALKQHGSWRAAKVHTRCGMGPCQGRICGEATRFLLGWGADSVRPPIVPVRIASLASIGAPLHTDISNSKETA